MNILYPRIRAAMLSSPWPLLPERLQELQAAMAYMLQGERLQPEEIRALVGERMESLRLLPANANAGVQAAEGDVGTAPGSAIAILGLKGLISHRIEQVEDISGPGGTSTERFGQRFRAALNSPEVGGIILDVNSPGGNSHGVRELADEIFAARQNDKPVVAVANAMAASAAFWIASAADELVVTPSGEVGSIGVWTIHQDLSEAFEREGVRNTLISAGKFKTEGNVFEPLSEEAQAAIQDQVDQVFDQFVSSVARARGVRVKQVREGFGQGRMVLAQPALREGMVDRVATLDQEIARMQRQMGRGRRGGGRRSEGPEMSGNELAGEGAFAVFPESTAGGDETTMRPSTEERSRALDLIEAELDLA